MMEENQPRITSLDIELTTRCYLRCRQCVRTVTALRDTRFDLSLTSIKKIFNENSRAFAPDLEICLCGNFGDCIYHPEFHEIISFFKSKNYKIIIFTNGSHRRSDWWKVTARILAPSDKIVFAVDGLEDTNHLYRVNSNFQSIMAGMEQCVGKVRVTWKYIVFSHNEHQVEEAGRFAREMGVNTFRICRNSRGDIHQCRLSPGQKQWISKRCLNKTLIKKYMRQFKGNQVKLSQKVGFRPVCLERKGFYLSYEGYLYPCCLVGESLELEESSPLFASNKEKFNLLEKSAQMILSDPIWAAIENGKSDYAEIPFFCLKRCGKAIDISRSTGHGNGDDHTLRDDILFHFTPDVCCHHKLYPLFPS